MYTDTLCPDLLHFRLRSARRRQRAQKEDFDKQLVQLDKKRDSLWLKRRLLPMVPLKEPYQKGWKRSFALRGDVAESNRAAFYSGILEKINTTQYHHDKFFRKKRRRHGKKVYEPIPQSLMTISEWYWRNGKMQLTEDEKACFEPQVSWGASGKAYEIKFAFSEPWRYMLLVQPHMITEVKMTDVKLEEVLKRLDNYIVNHQLSYRMRKLTNGRKQNRWRHHHKKDKGNNPYKNKAFHAILDECIF